MSNTWTPESWRNKPIQQQPQYPDAAHLSRVEQTLAFFADLEKRQGELAERDQLIVDVLTARQFGASTSPAKFEKMVRQHVDGVMQGQYVFNGAGQTGRYSSKSVQLHNLLRASLKDAETGAIEMINEVEL